nr:RNA/RNP complex-1-interacting phosphatase-like [Kogia breviceps]
MKENNDNDRLIGVHCTHGLNRTGYLICRYLIDVEGMWPDDAIEFDLLPCKGLERFRDYAAASILLRSCSIFFDIIILNLESGDVCTAL